MKLLVCIINDVYRDHLEKVLQKAGYRVTELASSGGFSERAIQRS
ncbi:cyclic-di-AMP receptor [Geomicrobium sp. JCM 19039]|nr:cyclic-di-AMP receptor [Geomicrobium sp. JCM 19039]